jgi:hypothetical protein
MSARNLKPSRWYYVLALLLPVCACLGTGLLVYPNVPKLPGALEAVGIENLTQVTVPGSAEIYFPKAGAYAVYYEYRGALDGVKYMRGKTPPSLSCQLTSKASGVDVAVTTEYIEDNDYFTRNHERAGVLIRSITIRDPGVYNFSCRYPAGRTSPPIVLAVGPNVNYELLNVLVKWLAALGSGALVFVAAGVLSILIVVFVAYKRRQAKNVLDSQA